MSTVFDQMKPNTKRVFISYSSIDRARTRGLGLLLEAMGHQVFRNHRTIKPGNNWQSTLQDGLNESDAIVVFWTKHAARSEWVRKEYEFFQTQYPHRPLVVVLGDETPLPEILKVLPHGDFAPLINEVLETKRKMKKAGASTGQIEQVVANRLREAGLKIADKRARGWVFLFLGFGWVRTLMRQPWESIQKIGRGAVEKAAQLSFGGLATLATMALMGGIGGHQMAAANAREMQATDVYDSIATIGAGLQMSQAAIIGVRTSQDDLAGRLATIGDSLINIEHRFATISETRDQVVRQLRFITTRFDDVRDATSLQGSLAQCEDIRVDLTDRVAGLSRQLALVQAASALATVAELDSSTHLGSTDNSGALQFERPMGQGQFVEPVLVFRTPPRYPTEAREQGIQGTVLVWARVEEDGTVSIDRTDGMNAVLNEAATWAVGSWLFTPGTVDGKPVTWDFSVPVHFAVSATS